ncbi:MAG: hypothetical protein OWT28_04025 [Firmicutes bacterium]|nr:hypothetical protein [Bacillota bacterium]
MALLAACTALIVTCTIPAVAATRPAMNLRVAIGFQNYYNPRVWAPVRVTVTDLRQRAIHGQLIFSIRSGGVYPYEGSLHWPVTVRPGAPSVLTVGIPGRLLQAGGQLTFVSGHTVLASSRLLGVPIETDMTGVVSQSPQSVQFLAGVSSASGTSEMASPFIPPTALPTNATLLQSLTYLYIDGAAAQALTEGQVGAIRQWTRAGGILVLGGMEPNAGQTAAFSRLSPVQPAVVLDQAGVQMGTYAGTPPPRGVVAQLVGAAKDQARVLVGSRQQALVAYQPYGRGEIGYVGLSVTSPNLISWPGNAIFWENFLHSLKRMTLSTTPDLFGASGAATLMGAAELFPQLHTPPLWIWELVFTIYLLLCGPLLYLFLRRRRKSEWAWLVLPGVSIVLAGAIYELGVVQRPNGILTQSVGLVDIIDGQNAQAVGMEAMMSPQARTYSVVMPAQTLAIPMADRLTGDAHDDEVNFTGGASSLQFNRVQAWGGRFVFAIRTTHKVGQLHGDLFISGKTVGGFITNGTSLNFASLAIVVSGQAFGLGPLREGQTAKVELLLRKQSAHTPFASQLGVALPSAASGVGRALFDYAKALASGPAPVGTAIVIGWTHQAPRLFGTDGAVLPAPPQWIVRDVLPMTTVTE